MLGKFEQGALIAFAGYLLLGCGQAPSADDPAHQTASAIIGGSHDTVDESVVLLLIQDDIQNPTKQSHCSASVVSPHVVLTAAHCLSGSTNSVGEPNYVAVFIGDDINDPVQGVDPSLFVFEKEHHYDPAFDPAVTVGNAHDIGVVITSKPVGPAPIALNRGARPEVGADLQLVGYGLTDPTNGDTWGARQTINAKVAGNLGASLYFQDSGMCGGDSGGPSLMTRDGTKLVASVHSYGEHATTCTGKGYDLVIGPEQLGFVDPSIEANDPGFLQPITPETDAAASDAAASDAVPDAIQPETIDAGAAGQPATGNSASSGCSLSSTRATNQPSIALLAGALLVFARLRRRSRVRCQKDES